MTLWFFGNLRCRASYSKTSKLYSPDSGFQRCRSRCRSHGANGHANRWFLLQPPSIVVTKSCKEVRLAAKMHRFDWVLKLEPLIGRCGSNKYFQVHDGIFGEKHPFVEPGFQAQKKTWSKKCRLKAFPRTPNLSSENICCTNYFQWLY